MRRQLILAAAAISSMIVLAFAIPLGALVRTLAEDRAVTSAEHTAETLAPVLASSTDPASLAPVVESLDAGDASQITVFLADGTIVGAPADLDDDVALARTGRAFRAADVGGTEVLVPVVVAGGQVDVVRAFVPDDVLRQGVVSAWLALAGLCVVLVVVSVLVADRFARFIVRPVRALADTAEQLGHGDLDARVTPEGPPELVEVATTLNQLAERIEALLEAERESVADLSHRLRTPIAAVRLDIDALPASEARDRLDADAVALTEAVDRLIADARRRGGAAAGTGAGGPVAPVAPLRPTVEDRAAFWSVLAEDQDRAWTVDTSACEEPGGCDVGVDADELAAAIDVMLGNVFDHTPEGVAVEVRLEPAPRADGWTVVVGDAGPGWPDGEDVLARGTSGGGSTGLGLDIVRRTAEASGGGVALRRSPLGGAELRATFGRAAAGDGEPASTKPG